MTVLARLEFVYFAYGTLALVIRFPLDGKRTISPYAKWTNSCLASIVHMSRPVRRLLPLLQWLSRGFAIGEQACCN